MLIQLSPGVVHASETQTTKTSVSQALKTTLAAPGKQNELIVPTWKREQGQ